MISCACPGRANAVTLAAVGALPGDVRKAAWSDVIAILRRKAREYSELVKRVRHGEESVRSGAAAMVLPSGRQELRLCHVSEDAAGHPPSLQVATSPTRLNRFRLSLGHNTTSLACDALTALARGTLWHLRTGTACYPAATSVGAFVQSTIPHLLMSGRRTQLETVDCRAERPAQQRSYE
jgi:hypothetical protein